MRRAGLIILVVLTAVCGMPGGSALAAPTAPPTTGNLLVLLDHDRASAAAGTTAVDAAVARLRGRPAGFSVPQIGLITVRPPGSGRSVFARSLRKLPGVASVQVEHRYVPRSVPNDPALSAPDPSSGVLEWPLAREGFYHAWNISQGNGAVVGVIDTGIDGSHPDLASKITAALNQQDPSDARGTARSDEVGHGTHVASLACADTNNGIGMAGAGYNCRLVIEKSDFSDSSIAASVVDATDRHVQALNMSFGPSLPSTSPSAPDSEVRALDYAVSHNVVLVGAAADSPGTEQGDPANVLQPAGTGANLSRGIGLDVTAAASSGARASFAGYGSEISLAAYGAFNPNAAGPPQCLGQPLGIFGAFPAGFTDLDSFPTSVCRASLQGSNRYAYLAGTSMAAPQVAAAAALMRQLNPYASVSDVIRTLKLTGQRPVGAGWTNDLGWGILNAGAALDAIRRLDRLAPVSRLVAPGLARRTAFRIRWSGHDQRRPGLIASGIVRYNVYVSVNGGRSRLLATTPRHSLDFHGRAGFRYVFFTVAIDRAGNRERHPADVRTRVARGAA